MNGPYQIWRPEARAPEPMPALSASGEIALDRRLLGASDGILSRTDNAPVLSVVDGGEASISVPGESGVEPLVFEGVTFAGLQAEIAPANQRWKISPGQLYQVESRVLGRTTTLCLMRDLLWEQPGEGYHLVRLPPARVLSRGSASTVRGPAVVVVGEGAVEIPADITQGAGKEPAPRVQCHAQPLSLPSEPYHVGLAPLLDEFETHVQPGLRLPVGLPIESASDLVAAASDCLRIAERDALFVPALLADRIPVLALAYTRADGSVRFIVSGPQIRAWVTDLDALFRRRPVSTRPPPPPVSATTECEAVSFGSIETRNPTFANVLEWARVMADSDADLILLGETGTGKEHLARAIHDASGRRNGPFVAVNCARETSELIESELFGHAKGSFTGAVGARKGQLLSADGGTLLLDELGDSSTKFQASLLRVLETRMVRPLGSDHAVRVDVRLIAATSRDLKHQLVRGEFREDLYYRLAGGEITLPPLRERREDLPELSRALLAREAPGATLDAAAVDLLSTYAWLGNVRELLKVLQAAAHKARIQSGVGVGETVVVGAEAFNLPSDPELWLAPPTPPVHFDESVRRVASQIWSERELPPLADLTPHKRRAVLRSALICLDVQTPRAEWPRALVGAWKRTFRDGWHGRERGRALREVVVVIAVRGREREAWNWVVRRAG